jgi:hypothetical protein
MRSLKDTFFPIIKDFEDINQPDDLERIKRNNYELSERLKEQERMEKEYPMKKYYLDVVSGGKVLPYIIEARSFDYGSNGTYYFYTYKMLKDGYREREILAHFPIDKTIITKIEIV